MEKKVRILHVAQAAGGVERYLQMLLKYMNREQFENILVCSNDYELRKFEKLIDGYEQIEMQREIGLHDINAIGVVRAIIKRYNPDVVYAHSSKAGAIARIANLGIKNRCIYNPHGWAFNMQCSKNKRVLYTIVERMLAPFCERIICISDAEKESAYRKHICPEAKLQVIFNGIDIQEYEEQKELLASRDELHIPADAFVVGMVGRLTGQKAPDVFIRAAELIKEKIPKSFFVIVGDGEMKEEVQQYAEEHGLGSSLLITGWVEKPMNYVRHFDVAMLLSRWEGFGLVLAEYMLAEKPIVATRVDAIPNIISDGVNGLLVAVNDVKTVKQAVLKIYNNKNLVEQITRQGYQDIYKYYDIRRVSMEHEVLMRNRGCVE